MKFNLIPILNILLIALSAISCSSYSNRAYLKKNAFELSHEDINFIQNSYKLKDYKTLSELPSRTSRPKVTEFFTLLKEQEDARWIKAYLFLLTIVPEIHINEEVGC
jgi:hypothetical protein|tara:strand:- start:1514 stop:1834 length:321 start_codon:yes stop_codon:yes gene_type:complete